MSRILNLIVQDHSDPKETVEFVVSFSLREDVLYPEKALRNAVAEFVSSGTVEAKEALAYANGFFNWGDAVRAVPDSLLIKNGLMPLMQNAVDVFVNHNETLYCEEPTVMALTNVKKLISNYIIGGEKDISYWERGNNIVADGIANEIHERIEKLRALLVMESITEDVIVKLIEAESDDTLIEFYESILDQIKNE